MIVSTGPDVVIRQTCPGRILEAHGSGVLSVVGMTLTGGVAEADGGAIKGGRVVLSRVTLRNNSAVSGGGVASATLTASDLTVTDNQATEWGGGVFVKTKAVIERGRINANEASRGGGIAVEGELSLSQTQVLDNDAAALGESRRVDDDDPATGWVVETGGAGIWAGMLVADRSTIARNMLAECDIVRNIFGNLIYSAGGGIRGETVTLRNTTVSGNSGPRSCHGPLGTVILSPRGIGVLANRLELEHATLVGNAGGDTITANELVSHASIAIGDRLCPDTSSVASYSWFSDNSCHLTGIGNREEYAPFLLGELADNGGPVPTHDPMQGSPVVDAVPAAECRSTVDARNVARPQGSSCDVGAVEWVDAPGVGPTDLALTFSNPTMVAGETVTWDLMVLNKGAAGSAPVVSLSVPWYFDLESITATNSGLCQTVWVLACHIPRLPAGESATIRVTGKLRWPASSVIIDAEVTRAVLQPPLTDDRATVTTPVTVEGTVRMDVTTSGDDIAVKVYSVGPYNAASWPEHPMRVRFHPAPGVRAEVSEYSFPDLLFGAGSYPGDFQIQLAFDGPPPAKLGDLELVPGLNHVDGPTLVPVSYAPEPDVAVRPRRQPGIFPEGTPIPISVEVVNLGAGTAQDVFVELRTDAPDLPPPTITWATVPRGTLTDFWRIPTLAAGERLTLQGTVVGGLPYTWLWASGSAETDENVANNGTHLNLAPSPNGTSDLLVEPLSVQTDPETGAHVIRASITNAGVTLDADIWNPRTVHLFRALGQPPSAYAGPPSGWSCSGTDCGSFVPIPAGSSFSFNYFIAPGSLRGVCVNAKGDQPYAPDADPSNNTQCVR